MDLSLKMQSGSISIQQYQGRLCAKHVMMKSALEHQQQKLKTLPTCSPISGFINLSGLYKSAQRKHELESAPHTDVATSLQPTALIMFVKQREWTNSENRSKLIDKLIIEMIVTDYQPFLVVSYVGFKRLTATAEPRYALKSKSYYLTKKLQVVHHKVVDKISPSPETAGLV